MFGYKFQRPPPNRHQLLVDNGLQSVVLRRLFLYCLGTLIYFVTILSVDVWIHEAQRTAIDFFWGFFDEAIYWAPGLIALGPMAAYDMLRVTNRFAGPAFSLEREMRRLAKGESVGPLSFRDEDHWHAIAESFNEIRDELARYREIGPPQERAAGPETGQPSPAPRERLFDENKAPDDAPEDLSAALS